MAPILIKRSILLFFFGNLATAQADPLISSWQTSISSKYARIYTTTANRTAGTSATTWSGTQSQTSPAYAGINEIDASANYVYIRTTGLGGHVMGPWSNPNLPMNQQDLWRFPRTPTVPTTNRTSASATPTSATGMGANGFMVDGVAAYNTSDGYSYSVSHNEDASPIAGIGQGDGVWNRDAFVNEAVSFDYALAHNQPSGEYHYHVNPITTRYLLGDNVLYSSSTKQYSENTAATTFTHSPILGWMKDGLPLYGPYGYDGGGTGATATATLSGGAVGSVSVNSAGLYTSTPAVAFSSGNATATTHMKVVSAVVATAANSSAGGTGYKVGDVLTVAGGTATTPATLTVATITGTGSGPIATLTISQAGSYSVVPPNYVNVTGGSGSGAVPTLLWGVGSVTVTSGGSGYAAAPTVTIGGVRRMTSGYQLRNGTNGTTDLNTTGRTTLPGWALTSQGRASQITSGQYGPAVSTTYTLGHYAEDYDYLGDLGNTQGSLANTGGVFFDLDEYNARFCITPDYPNGTWAYFNTIKSDGTSFFPYHVGRWYRGNPNTGGGSTTASTMSSDGATVQFLGGANSAISIGTPNVAGGTVTLTWNSVEGGTYAVANSPNDSTWTSEVTGLSPSNVPIAPTTGDATVTTTSSYSTTGLSGTQYAKVSRTALAAYDSAGQTAATVAQSATASFIVPSNDATLSGLSLSVGTLSPAFASGTTSYTATVTTSSITVTPTATQADATITVNGTAVPSGFASGSIALSPGTNTITIVVTAPNEITTQTYTVTVTFNAGTAIQTWRQTYYGTTANSGDAADTAEPYNNGVPNLTAFAFGLNPATANISDLPTPQISGGNIFYNFTQPESVNGITYGAEWSTTLQSWTAISDTGTGDQHIFSVPIGSNTKIFLRLILTDP